MQRLSVFVGGGKDAEFGGGKVQPPRGWFEADGGLEVVVHLQDAVFGAVVAFGGSHLSGGGAVAGPFGDIISVVRGGGESGAGSARQLESVLDFAEGAEHAESAVFLAALELDAAGFRGQADGGGDSGGESEDGPRFHGGGQVFEGLRGVGESQDGAESSGSGFAGLRQGDSLGAQGDSGVGADGEKQGFGDGGGRGGPFAAGKAHCEDEGVRRVGDGFQDGGGVQNDARQTVGGSVVVGDFHNAQHAGHGARREDGVLAVDPQFDAGELMGSGEFAV